MAGSGLLCVRLTFGPILAIFFSTVFIEKLGVLCVQGRQCKGGARGAEIVVPPPPPPCAVDPLNLSLWLHAGSEYPPGGAVHIFMTFNRPDLTAHGQHTECAISTPMHCTYPNHTNPVAVKTINVPPHGRPLFLGRGCEEGKPFLQDSCRFKRPCQLGYGRKEYH